MTLSDRLRARITDHTPGVGWVFLGCRECSRVVPYYRLYGKDVAGRCRWCRHDVFRAVQIPEWQAALWLVWGWMTRQGDPRMPLREAPTKYA